MRLPLFGNGFPRNVLGPDGAVTVFDTEAVNEATVYALTLYLWVYQSGFEPFTLPTLSIRVETDGGAPLEILHYTQGYLGSIFEDNNGPPPIQPIKVLDKYMVRGSQKVTVLQDGTASPSCFLWGFYEIAGAVVVDEPFRGLQPVAKPSAPFSFEPAAIDLAAADTSASEVLHKLDPAYFDVLTVDLSLAGTSAEGTADFAATLGFPGPVVLPMPSILQALGASPSLSRNRIFDGIPMRALDASAAGSEIRLGAAVGPAGLSLRTRSFGSFRRT